jgi:hypothetical protein
MTSTEHEKAHYQGGADQPVGPRLSGSVPSPVSSDRLLGSPNEALCRTAFRSCASSLPGAQSSPVGLR